MESLRDIFQKMLIDLTQQTGKVVFAEMPS